MEGALKKSFRILSWTSLDCMECWKRWKYGTVLFLPSTVGVWKLEGRQQLVEFPMRSFGVKT
jgi:hypothetical protein